MTTKRDEQPADASPKKRTSRRRFLAVGGGAVLAAAAGGVVLVTATEGTPAADWPRCDCSGKQNATSIAPSTAASIAASKETKMSKVLVAYASRCGSTGEIAAAIGEELCAAGAEVVVKPVGEVKGLDGFDALVLGSATRMGKLLPEATGFLKKYASAPAMAHLAYFTAGTGPLDPNPATREVAITKPVGQWRAIREPLAYRVFTGKVDHLKMAFPFKQVLGFVKDGVMVDADHRDFYAIRAWAREIAPTLRVA